MSNTYKNAERVKYVPQFITPEQYTDARIAILRSEFFIQVTPEEAEHLRNLKTQAAIDAGIKTIINKHWG